MVKKPNGRNGSQKQKAQQAQQEKSPREKEFRQLKRVEPRNLRQEIYLQSIESNTVTIGLGPAGSGKTYLAVYEALLQHWSKQKKRMIISRPAVEAGEKLGFLPGDMSDKLDPYMRPIYDALFDLMGVQQTAEKIERGYIEVAPLAYMRGRTFNNCFIILDEAQNATIEQLKMVLTRIGENCTVVVDGDPGQSDLPGYRKKSGLLRLREILKNTPSVGIVEFSNEDIVRHPVVIDIVKAFEEYENNESES